MENGSYKNITPLKKKRTKITFSAAIVLCAVVFVVGILIGRAAAGNKQTKEMTKRLQDLEQEQEIELSRMETELATYKSEISRVKGELAQYKQSEADEKRKQKKEDEEQATDDKSDEGDAAPADEADKAAKSDKDTAPDKTQKSGAGRKILITVLVVIILVCLGVGGSIIFRRGEEELDGDEEDEYEEYDEYDEDEDEDDEE